MNGYTCPVRLARAALALLCLALLVRSLGVLVTGLGMIAGQLLGSLGLDLAVPAPGTVVAARYRLSSGTWASRARYLRS